MVHAGQAEDLDRVFALDGLHQGRQRRLHCAKHDDRLLAMRVLAEQVPVLLVEHPLHHRPGHHRKSGHEVHRPARTSRATEAGDLVVRVGNNVAALRKHGHVQPVAVVGALGLIGKPLFPGHVLHALVNQSLGLRVQGQGQAQRARRALAGMVIRRGADAPKRKHHIPAAEGARQSCGDAVGVVAHVIGVRDAEAPRAQQFDGAAQVLVGAFARENFIANDQESKVHVQPFKVRGSSTPGCGVTGPARCRKACRPARQK